MLESSSILGRKATDKGAVFKRTFLPAGHHTEPCSAACLAAPQHSVKSSTLSPPKRAPVPVPRQPLGIPCQHAQQVRHRAGTGQAHLPTLFQFRGLGKDSVFEPKPQAKIIPIYPLWQFESEIGATCSSYRALWWGGLGISVVVSPVK